MPKRPSQLLNLNTVLLLCLGLLAVTPSAYAVNLGVQGTTWPIIEIDIRTLMVQQAAQTNWKGVQSELKASAKHYFTSLPKRATTDVSDTQTRWYDPSFTLQNNIWAPEKNSKGQWKWKLLYPKGTTVNPLNYERPTNAMLFFNGHSKAQVAFVAAAIKKFPAKLMLIEASGMDPQPLALKVHAPVFTETAQMAQRFDLSRTPSLLYPGSGARRLYLGYTTYAPPFSLKALEKTWPKEFETTQEAVKK